MENCGCLYQRCGLIKFNTSVETVKTYKIAVKLLVFMIVKRIYLMRLGWRDSGRAQDCCFATI